MRALGDGQVVEAHVRLRKRSVAPGRPRIACLFSTRVTCFSTPLPAWRTFRGCEGVGPGALALATWKGVEGGEGHLDTTKGSGTAALHTEAAGLCRDVETVPHVVLTRAALPCCACALRAAATAAGLADGEAEELSRAAQSELEEMRKLNESVVGQVKSKMGAMRWKILLARLTQWGGIQGTIAVALGGAFGVNALSLVHAERLDDLALGLALVAPLLAIDAAVMAPDWPKRNGEHKAALKAEAEAAAGGGEAEVSTSASVSASLPAWRSVAADVQRASVVGNPAILLSFPQEVALLSVGHLAEEMLYRGVALTLVARWVADRMFEAGLDTPLYVRGLEVEDAAPWAALALTVALRAALVLRAVGKMPTQMAVKRVTKGPDGERRVEEARVEELGEQQQAAVARNLRVLKLGRRYEGAREVYEALAQGLAFTATGGNLAAPLAGAILHDFVFSSWQRAMRGRYNIGPEGLPTILSQALGDRQADVEAFPPKPAPLPPVTVSFRAEDGTATSGRVSFQHARGEATTEDWQQLVDRARASRKDFESKAARLTERSDRSGDGGDDD